MKTITPDKKALKILFDTYWGAGGWKDSRETAPEDLEYAKAAGVMFDPSSYSHNEITNRAVRVAGKISPIAVADAFVASLGSRRLDLRSALGSFAVLRHFPSHEAELDGRQCKICGEYDQSSNEDLNVFNFERFKWGGVRHDVVGYALFDLEQFSTTLSNPPTDMDIRILGALIEAIESAPDNMTANALQKHLAPIVKSNKSEREILIAILGLTGILSAIHHPGYLTSFVRSDERELPSRRFVDMTYPACWWRRSDGINAEAVEFWFGHHLRR
ncbi:MAG: hypothetical protein AAF585_14050 [Verrucomicrobiota bacterium]